MGKFSFTRYFLYLVVMLPLAACGNTRDAEDWDRIIDDMNYSGASKKQCEFEAPLTTKQFDGYSVSTQMPCNDWLAKISNQSKYQIRCVLNGTVMTAEANSETNWTQIGQGNLSAVNCRYFNGPVRIANNFDNYIIQEQLRDGDYFLRVKNTRDYKQRCQIKDKNRQPIDTFDLQARETSIWVNSEKLGFTACRRAVN